MSHTKLKALDTSQRKRASTPRSKTGCVTCKIRRLKCGEEKPSCVRCTKSGWHCDGYDHVLKASSTRPKEVALAPIFPRTPSQSPSPLPSLQTPSFVIDLDEQEYSYFQSFIDDVSWQLPSYDAFFWRGIVLRESHFSFAIRHAIVAIGALAKSTNMIISGTRRMEPSQGVHRKYATQQYQMALRGFQSSISTSSQQYANESRTVVIICIILAFFDSFIGNGRFAIKHICYAREFCYDSKSLLSRRSSQPDQEQEQIASMFLRLDMQALSTTGPEEDRTYIMLEPRQASFAFPPRFTSVDEARSLRNTLVWEGTIFLYRTVKYQKMPVHQIPVSILQQRDHFVESFRMLNHLLSVLVQGAITDYSMHPIRRPKGMKLHSTILLIQMALVFGASETAFNGLLSEFAFLCEISKETIDFESMLSPAVLEGEAFTFDVRIIPALSVVATKCRTHCLRRQAISLLLSSHRREWMHDSLLAGKTASWMMDLEKEASLSTPTASTLLSSSYSSETSPITTSSSSHSNAHSSFEDWCTSKSSGLNLGESLVSIDQELIEDWFMEPPLLIPPALPTPHFGSQHYNSAVSNGHGEELYIEERNRAWGEMVEVLDVPVGRRARVRCRQNFRHEDGSVRWRWKETEVSW